MNDDEIRRIKKIKESISTLQDVEVKLAVSLTRIRPLLSKEDMKTLEDFSLVCHRILSREISKREAEAKVGREINP